jgi:hypothetical protein
MQIIRAIFDKQETLFNFNRPWALDANQVGIVCSWEKNRRGSNPISLVNVDRGRVEVSRNLDVVVVLVGRHGGNPPAEAEPEDPEFGYALGLVMVKDETEVGSD